MVQCVVVASGEKRADPKPRMSTAGEERPRDRRRSNAVSDDEFLSQTCAVGQLVVPGGPRFMGESCDVCRAVRVEDVGRVALRRERDGR